MRGCDTPIPDDTLIDYWIGAGDARAETVEAHLFACAGCTARLAEVSSLAAGVVTLVRQGRFSGLVSRSLVNCLQLDGVRLRTYTVSPGETLPCTVFPSDDLVVTSLRADLSTTRAVTLSMTGASAPLGEISDIPVDPSSHEVLFALPGSVVRDLPSTRLTLTLTSAGDDRAVLGEYVLEHTRTDSAAG